MSPYRGPGLPCLRWLSRPTISASVGGRGRANPEPFVVVSGDMPTLFWHRWDGSISPVRARDPHGVDQSGFPWPAICQPTRNMRKGCHRDTKAACWGQDGVAQRASASMVRVRPRNPRGLQTQLPGQPVRIPSMPERGGDAPFAGLVWWNRFAAPAPGEGCMETPWPGRSTVALALPLRILRPGSIMWTALQQHRVASLVRAGSRLWTARVRTRENLGPGWVTPSHGSLSATALQSRGPAPRGTTGQANDSTQQTQIWSIHAHPRHCRPRGASLLLGSAPPSGWANDLPQGSRHAPADQPSTCLGRWGLQIRGDDNGSAVEKQARVLIPLLPRQQWSKRLHASPAAHLFVLGVWCRRRSRSELPWPAAGPSRIRTAGRKEDHA